jgi:glycyl-tRNA synthetase beta chain
VILYQNEREKLILSQIKNIENKHNIQVELDKELLAEIVAITEYPSALLGTFDKEFLKLPKEVIIGSMKEHQRYFAVFKDGNITNKFIVVSNSKTDDFSHIISGNEKVLRARLSDGMFFYQNDLKNGLNNQGLKKVTFIDGLGTIYDKCERELKIALKLSKIFNTEDQNKLLEKTIMLSKADLLSDMVGEFGNLQGLMGYYYAKYANEDKLLYTAIKEQYYPKTQNGKLPSNIFSSVVALSNKLDNLIGLFSIGKIPTSSRDPFALRRSAFGVVKISIEHKLNLDIKDIVLSVSDNYDKFDTKKLFEFFEDRFYQLFSDTNPSVIKAVLKSGETNILKINDKIKALNPIVISDDFKNYSTTFKRVANIIKDINIDKNLQIKQEFLKEDAEKQLYLKFEDISKTKYKTYKENLDALFSLKPQLDNFFDNVFVNDKDKNLQTNRKNIIGCVYKAFKNIADIKEITI